LISSTQLKSAVSVVVRNLHSGLDETSSRGQRELNLRGVFAMQRRYTAFSLCALIISLFTNFAVASAQAADRFADQGCVLDGPALEVLGYLRTKEYSDEQVITACNEAARWSPGRPDRIVDDAILVSLGFSDAERRRVLRKQTPLGEFLVRAYHINERKRLAGVLTMSGGILLSLSGVALWVLYREGDDHDNVGGWGGFEDLGRAMGIVFMVAGGLTTAAGISVVALAHALSHRYSAPAFMWDTHNKVAIERWYRSHYSPKKADKRTSLNVSPVISREFTGLSMQLRF
jgi:hypothetical protein